MNNLRVALIHNILSPHVEPVFRELAKRYDLTVLYCAEKEENRRWSEKPEGYKYKVLPEFQLKLKGKDLFTYIVNPTIIKELDALQPDVVIISGWDLFSYQAAFFYCRRKKIKIILWAGSTENEKTMLRKISLPLVKTMVKGSSAFIAYGQKSRDYLISLGASPTKIFISFNTTDIDKYKRGVRKDRLKKAQIKRSLKLDNRVIVMYYGQLLERKGVDLLIKAFAKVNEDRATLTIVGTGNFKDFLISEAKNLSLKNVLFIEDPGDDPACKYYAVSDIFVLPSRQEIWGLVVNQAMAAGLPVIVSDKVGSSVDLVKPGRNGFVFESENIGQLSEYLVRLISAKKLREEFSAASEELIKEFIPEKTVEGVISAIKYVSTQAV